MNPLIIVMTFILLFTFLTTSEVKKYIGASLSEKAFSTVIDEQLRRERLKEKAYLQEIKAQAAKKDDIVVIKEGKRPKDPSSNQRPKKRNYKLNFDIYRPPNNSRFNLYLMLFNEKLEDEMRLTFMRLLKILYQDSHFYHEIPNFEQLFCDKIFACKDLLADMETIEQLAILEFEELKTRDIFFLMLEGNDETPSLLNYLTFDRNVTAVTKKTNLLFASEALLGAILDDERASRQVIMMRDNIMAEMRQAETTLTRSMISDLLREQLLAILQQEGLPMESMMKRFDFGVGKPGNVLFYRSQLTNKLLRDRLPKP